MRTRFMYLISFSALILIIIGTTLKLLLPFLISQFINDFYNGVNPFNVIVLYTGCSIILFFVVITQKFVVEKITWDYTNNIRKKLLDQILNSDDSLMSNYSLGNLLEYFEEDINKIYVFVSSSLPNLISNFLTIVFIVVFFSVKFIGLLPVFLVYIILDLLISNYLKNNNQKDISDEINYHKQMSGKYSEWLRLNKIIKVSQSNSSFTKRFESLQDGWLKHRILSNKFHYKIWCTILTLNVFFDVIILLISGILFSSNIINIGGVYLFYSLAKKIQSPMESIQQQFQSGIKYNYSLKRINKFLLDKSKLKSGNTYLTNTITNVMINNLSFSYNKQELILNKINLNLYAGDIVGVYGKSGDGKSTLCKVLARIIDIDDNTLIVNELDVNQYNLQSYYNESAYFSNDSYIMINASLYDNLVMYNEDISVDYVHDIMLKFKLYDLLKIEIRTKEDILLNVKPLSQGQKQLLSLYRALFAKKSLLIFDEATSDIDINTTTHFFNILSNLNSDAIYIIVSHQLEKLEMCNRLYRMEKGFLYEKYYD